MIRSTRLVTINNPTLHEEFNKWAKQYDDDPEFSIIDTQLIELNDNVNVAYALIVIFNCGTEITTDD